MLKHIGGKILVSVTCDKCKHRPEYDEDGTIIAPRIDDAPYNDYTCPYVCPDEYYNTMPEDHDFCSKGERKLNIHSPSKKILPNKTSSEAWGVPLN